MFKKLWNALNSLKKKEGGFTLIELAVIMAVIGILAGVGVMKYVDVTTGARKTNAEARKADIKSCISMAMAKNGGHANGAMVDAIVLLGYPEAVVTSTTGIITFPDVKDTAGNAIKFQLLKTGKVAITKEGTTTWASTDEAVEGCDFATGADAPAW